MDAAEPQSFPRPLSSSVARCASAVVVTVAITLHWIPNYWAFTIQPLMQGLPHPWSYLLPTVILGALLTVWAPRTFGLAWARTWHRRKLVIVVCGGMNVVSIAVMLFLKTPFYGMNPGLYVCIPLYEELLFRGFLYAVVADAFPRQLKVGRIRCTSAVVITGVAFGVWHLGGLRLPTQGFFYFQVFYTTIAGCLYAYVREQSGSLWGPWLFHFIVDLWATEVPGFWAGWE